MPSLLAAVLDPLSLPLPESLVAEAAAEATDELAALKSEGGFVVAPAVPPRSKELTVAGSMSLEALAESSDSIDETRVSGELEKLAVSPETIDKTELSADGVGVMATWPTLLQHPFPSQVTVQGSQ